MAAIPGVCGTAQWDVEAGIAATTRLISATSQASTARTGRAREILNIAVAANRVNGAVSQPAHGAGAAGKGPSRRSVVSDERTVAALVGAL